MPLEAQINHSMSSLGHNTTHRDGKQENKYYLLTCSWGEGKRCRQKWLPVSLSSWPQGAKLTDWLSSPHWQHSLSPVLHKISPLPQSPFQWPFSRWTWVSRFALVFFLHLFWKRLCASCISWCFFTGWMPFRLPNMSCQSTEGNRALTHNQCPDLILSLSTIKDYPGSQTSVPFIWYTAQSKP